MPAAQLRHVVAKEKITLRTATGWALEDAVTVVVTDRGTSKPSPKKVAKLGLVHSLTIKPLARDTVEVWQTLENVSGKTCRLREVGVLDGRLRLEGGGWQVMHPELFKIERYFGGYSLYTNGLLGPLPGTEGEFGLSEDTPFPGIAFTHPERGTVLMSVLTQERCKPVWRLATTRGGVSLQALDAFTGIPTIPLPAGATFEGERWVVISVKGGIEDALDRYYKLLRRRHHFYGENSVLREEIVWGSWNYNSRPKGHGDINHKHIIEQARGLKKLHPRAQWVMIDAGYQIQNPRMAESCDFICLEIFDPDAPTPHDPTRFPKGMAHTAAEIQRAGRKPAIWCSPRTHNYGWVSKRTPEWLVRFEGGRTMLNNQAYLDYSIPEVRDYTRRAWETLFCEWGYAGLKLDFWTTAFETPGLQFRNKDKTAIELRNMFMQDVRDFVPGGGYLLTCCTVNAGNPFFGLYADASRMGTDLGDGLWSQVMLGATWVSAASAFYRNACLLPDPDTIGWCPHLTEEENRLWATAALMVGGMCEIGGDMVRLTPPQRTFMRAVCDFHGPAEVCRNNLFTGGAGSVPATHWQLERGKDTVEAVLNWSGLPRRVKMKTRGNDLWTGARVAGDTTVPRHAAVVV